MREPKNTNSMLRGNARCRAWHGAAMVVAVAA